MIKPVMEDRLNRNSNYTFDIMVYNWRRLRADMSGLLFCGFQTYWYVLNHPDKWACIGDFTGAGIFWPEGELRTIRYKSERTAREWLI
jgi:hypothetical protein